jgi:hypothetical protein
VNAKPIVAFAAALLVSGCGQQLKPSEIRAAMPAASVVKIDAQDPSGGAATPRAVPLARLAAATAAPVAGGQAPLAVTSYLFASAVNGGVFWTLAPITWFTYFVPPTSCTTDACTWGPGSDATDLNQWMLVVTKDGDAYDFVLSGAPKSTGGTRFVPVISGRSFPGAAPHRGHGDFAADLDAAWAGLDHAAGEVQKDFGKISVTWDARTNLSLGVTFLGSKNNDDPGLDAANPNRVNAVYAFAADAAGGDMQVGWRTIPGVGQVEEHAALHTRWKTDLGGRADVSYQNPGAAVQLSQCWAGPPAWLMTFDGSVVPPAGDAAACIFADPAWPTIAVP